MHQGGGKPRKVPQQKEEGTGRGPIGGRTRAAEGGIFRLVAAQPCAALAANSSLQGRVGCGKSSLPSATPKAGAAHAYSLGTFLASATRAYRIASPGFSSSGCTLAASACKQAPLASPGVGCTQFGVFFDNGYGDGYASASAAPAGGTGPVSEWNGGEVAPLRFGGSSFCGRLQAAAGGQLVKGFGRCLSFVQVRCGATAAVDGTAVTVPRPWKTSDCRLVLEDGSIWRGKSFGATGTQVGEVVFNTSLTGYQEILTDPSYAGQFVLMTQPHIGNTGINLDDEESGQCFMGGLVIRSLSNMVSNWRSSETLPEYLAKRNVMGISDIDTRAITRRLRDDGSLIGVLTTDESKTDDELIEMSKIWKIVGKDLITDVSCSEPYEWKDKTDSDWEFSTTIPDGDAQKFHVVAYDFGVKQNILRRLTSYGCKITVVPSTYPSSEVLKLSPDGILFSNGPGDPSAVPYAVKSVQDLIGKVPVFGICMGHQLLGQALGGTTFKMKFGHHGGNHPVRHLPTGRVEISAQNHNYAVDPNTLPEGVEVTHINLNDGTCAGLTFPAMKAMSIQYHPEASPGPHDSDQAFFDFVEMMKKNRTKA